MKKNLLILICGLLPGYSFSQIDYFGQEPPGDSAIIFAPGIISLDDRFDQSITISPDGTEFLTGVSNMAWDYFSFTLSKKIGYRLATWH